jgi:hypothetical protein
VTVRAVVLPATPLLVPGAAGAAIALGAVRDAVLEPLRRAAGPGTDASAPQRWGVLADGAQDRRGARRASLAAAGMADRWVPDLPGPPVGEPDSAVAGVAASIGLWAVGAAAGAPALAGVEVVELAGGADPDAVAAALDVLAAVDVLVVAATGPRGPGTAAGRVLAALADRGDWSGRTVEVPVDGPHLLATYAVTTWEGAAR